MVFVLGFLHFIRNFFFVHEMSEQEIGIAKHKIVRLIEDREHRRTKLVKCHDISFCQRDVVISFFLYSLQS